jgi:hypothetical protein
MGLMDVISGRRYHFNSEVTPAFGDIYNRRDDIVKDITTSDIETLKKVIEFLLFSSFLVIESMFGERGFRKEYLKKIDRNKTRQLLATLYISFFLSLTGNQYYKKRIREHINEDDIHLIYTRLFGNNITTIKERLRELSGLDNAGRMSRLIKKIYSIVLGVGEDQMAGQKLQDMIILGSTYTTAFETSFETLTKV